MTSPNTPDVVHIFGSRADTKTLVDLAVRSLRTVAPVMSEDRIEKFAEEYRRALEAGR